MSNDDTRRISARIPTYLWDGIETVIGPDSPLTITDVVRQGLGMWAKEHEMELPDHVEKSATFDAMKRRNRMRFNTLHFKQRCFEYARDALFTDRGDMKRYPPDPEHFREVFVDAMTEEVEGIHEEHIDTYREHVEQVVDWYELMHPEGTADEPYTEGVALCEHYIRFGRKDRARQVAEKAAEHVVESDHEILDAARSNVADKSWRHQWDEAINRPAPGGATDD